MCCGDPVRRTTMQAFTDGVYFKRFVDCGFEFHFAAAPPAAIGGHDQFATRVVDAIDQRRAGEAAEDDRVRRADARARQHRNRELRNQRHVERDAIAALNVRVFQNVRKLADFGVQLLISERARLAGFTFPDQRGFVASPGGEMPVETVVRDIDLAADKPLGVRWVPLQNRVPLLEPVKLLRPCAPRRLPDRRPLPRASFSSSSIDLMWACSEKDSGGGKTRSSWSTDSMFVVTVDTNLVMPLRIVQTLRCVPVYHRIA